MLTNEQIDNLLNNEALRHKNNGKVEAASRYKFPAKQPLAPIPNDGSPPETLCEVQCHDFSVRDVRYFSDDRPTTDKVIIGLGVPSPKRWLVAEIEDSRAAFMYGKNGFLVTARFVASVPSDVLADEVGNASTETADAAAAAGE